MPEHEAPVDAVIAALRANPLDFEGSIPELRSEFERLGASPDPDASIEDVIGGIPVRRFPARQTAADGRRNPGSGVVLFLHSGGYVAGTALGSSGLAMALAAATGREVISVDYRLAPEAPYPAARDDTLCAYSGLLEDKDPGEIALVGASAGGGVVIHALMEMRERGLPIPGAAAVISPFVDLTLSGDSYERNADRDPSLTRRGLEAAASHYAASGRAVDPAAWSLQGFPPIQIHVGSIEILLSDSVNLAARLASDDVHVELEVWPGMVHVFPTFSAKLVEGTEALERIGVHLDRWLLDASA